MRSRAHTTRRFVATSTLISLGALALVPTCEQIARAEASLADKAAAQSLFDEGRKLMAEGKTADACPKLAESQKLDPGVGTQFHLADCYERLGWTASAWAGFLEVASSAKGMGQAERERVARERAAALVPRLSKLTVVLAGDAAPGLEIRRDNAIVGRALWGTAIPVDPGSHTLEATAPGKKTWQSTVVIGERATEVVTVRALEDAPAAPKMLATVATPSPEGHSDANGAGRSRRTLGFVVGGLGAVGLGLGGVFALSAKSKYNESLEQNRCDPSNKNLCNGDGLALRDDARSKGDLASVFVGVGAVALAAGAIIVLTAPSGESAHVAVAPSVAPGTAGLSLVGTY